MPKNLGEKNTPKAVKNVYASEDFPMEDNHWRSKVGVAIQYYHAGKSWLIFEPQFLTKF